MFPPSHTLPSEFYSAPLMSLQRHTHCVVPTILSLVIQPHTRPVHSMSWRWCGDAWGSWTYPNWLPMACPPTDWRDDDDTTQMECAHMSGRHTHFGIAPVDDRNGGRASILPGWVGRTTRDCHPRTLYRGADSDIRASEARHLYLPRSLSHERDQDHGRIRLRRHRLRGVCRLLLLAQY